MVTIQGGADVDPGERVRVYWHSVSPGFFRTLGIALVRGRTFDDRDASDATRVAMISERMAARYWPDRDPLGASLRGAVIVGVVKDVQFRGLVPDPVQNPDDPDIYFPIAQRPVADLSIMVRSPAGLDAAVATVRREVRALDPTLALHSETTMDEALGRQTTTSRVAATQLGFFAIVALVLAATGLYGLVSFMVHQRTNEIGVRMALGANSGMLIMLMLKHVFRIVVAGIAIGIVVAMATGRMVESQLYDVAGLDIVVYGAATAVFLALAGVATVVPALRAARIDPITALRGG